MENTWEVAIGGGIVYGVLMALGKTDMLVRVSADGANGTAGVNERGDVVLGMTVFIKSLSIREALLCLLSLRLLNLYRVQELCRTNCIPMAAQNNLEMLIDGASWMNAAAYTNAAFGQNYSGSAVGNE